MVAVVVAGAAGDGATAAELLADAGLAGDEYSLGAVFVGLLLQLVKGVSITAMMFGAAVPFVPQYLKMKKDGSTHGFSTKVIMTLLAAYILRVCFWFGHHYEMPLLVQAIFMICALLFLQHTCVSLTAASNKDHYIFTGYLDPATFWLWPQFRDYVFVALVFACFWGVVTWVFVSNEVVVEGIGLLSLLIEACLGLPQFLRNFNNKSTAGMSVVMVFFWFAGDVFKTSYYVLRSAPMQFYLCGLLQICVDVLLFAQIPLYKKKHKTVSKQRIVEI